MLCAFFFFPITEDRALRTDQAGPVVDPGDGGAQAGLVHQRGRADLGRDAAAVGGLGPDGGAFVAAAAAAAAGAAPHAHAARLPHALQHHQQLLLHRSRK